MNGYTQTAMIMKALGHPARLQILEILRQEESCVCHLEHILGQRQAYISQQLSRLREAGLVIDRRQGMNVFYALADESIGPLLDAVRATATSIAQAEGQALTFPKPGHANPESCPCPKCHDVSPRGLPWWVSWRVSRRWPRWGVPSSP